MKKALSFILALALAISLVPTAVFATTEETTEQSALMLDFTKATYSKVNPHTWTVQADAGWEVDPENTTETYYSQNLRETGVVTLELTNSSSAYRPWWSFTSGTNNNTKAGRNALIVKTTEKISEGYYRVKVRGGKALKGGRAFVYVNEQFAGTFDSYDSALTSSDFPKREDDVVLNTLKLTPKTDENGDPYVSVMITSAEPEANERRVVAISSITLEPVASADAATPDKIVIEAPESVVVGTTATVSAYVLMKDGSKKYLNGVKKNESTNSYPYCATPDKDNYIDITVSDNATFLPDFDATYGTSTANKQGIFTNEDGTATGTISAEIPGTVTVTVEAKIEGEALTPATATIVVPADADAEDIDNKISYIVRAEDSANNSKITVSDTSYEGIGKVGEWTVGEFFTATAEGDDFVYWANGSGAPVSTSPSYTFKPTSNFTLEAVYAPADSQTKKVQFWNYNKVFLDEITSTGESLGAAMPDDPTLNGWSFTGWKTDEGTAFDATTIITEAITRVVAQFEKNVAGFSVGGETKAYDEPVTNTPATAPGGKVFSHWTINGQVASYEESFTFNVWDTVDVEAVYADEAPVSVPTIVLDKVSSEEYFILYEVPEGYTAVDAGIVFGSNETVTVDSTDGSKASVKQAGAKGQFTAAPHEGASSDIKARGYVMYKDTNNNLRILYTDAQ